MPGRNPQEALRAYLDPLQAAVSCLPGGGKIVHPPAKVKKVGDTSAWLLNDKDGLHVPGLGALRAQQHFELVATDHSRFGSSVGKFRVKTLSYLYSLRLDTGGHEICWHWHPTGNSKEPRPHMHYSGCGGAHLLCPRQTFEDVVESCIEILRETTGDDPNSDDDYWQERLSRLDSSRNVHTENRSWVNWPRARATVMEIVDVAQQRLKRAGR
jgi:hypothetical protein